VANIQGRIVVECVAVQLLDIDGIEAIHGTAVLAINLNRTFFAQY
jgi:hypothetical protein